MIIKNSVTRSNFTSQFHIANIFILNNFRPFSTTTQYLSPGEDKGKGKATKEDMVR